MAIRIGGDPSEYMQAPSLIVGKDGKGGGQMGLIAGILDLLGIHRQVAKPPKDGKTDGKDSKSNGANDSPAGMVDPKGGAPEFTPGKGGESQASIAPPPGSSLKGDATPVVAAQTLPVLDQVHSALVPGQVPVGLDPTTWNGGYRTIGVDPLLGFDPNALFKK